MILTCPHCGRQLDCTGLRGVVSCPYCGQPFTVPSWTGMPQQGATSPPLTNPTPPCPPIQKLGSDESLTSFLASISTQPNDRKGPDNQTRGSTPPARPTDVSEARRAGDESAVVGNTRSNAGNPESAREEPRSIACPHCHVQLRLPRSLEGKQTTCPKCQTQFVASECASAMQSNALPEMRDHFLSFGESNPPAVQNIPHSTRPMPTANSLPAYTLRCENCGHVVTIPHQYAMQSWVCSKCNCESIVANLSFSNDSLPLVQDEKVICRARGHGAWRTDRHRLEFNNALARSRTDGVLFQADEECELVVSNMRICAFAAGQPYSVRSEIRGLLITSFRLSSYLALFGGVSIWTTDRNVATALVSWGLAGMVVSFARSFFQKVVFGCPVISIPFASIETIELISNPYAIQAAIRVVRTGRPVVEVAFVEDADGYGILSRAIKQWGTFLATNNCAQLVESPQGKWTIVR